MGQLKLKLTLRHSYKIGTCVFDYPYFRISQYIGILVIVSYHIVVGIKMRTRFSDQIAIVLQKAVETI